MIFYVLTIGIPLIISFKSVLSGGIPFWFDPARDLLLALDNLKKPSLIGPPSGIPGIFYGPYWIWMLSTGLVFSGDPRIVTLIVLTIPYLILFPFLLKRLAIEIGQENITAIWFLFFISSNNYILSLWNPHLAPLIFLFLFCIVPYTNMLNREISARMRYPFAGFVNGLLINFHISFGIAIFTAVVWFYIFDCLVLCLRKGVRKVNDGLLVLALFITGFMVSFLPFFLFELRHGFNQSKSIFKTLINGFVYNSAVVGQTGLRGFEIVETFLKTFSNIFIVSNWLNIPVGIIIGLFILLAFFRNKLRFSPLQSRLLGFILVSSTSILVVFMKSKNPVWSYHFIGTEVLVIILIGIFIQKIPVLRKLLIIWSVFLIIRTTYATFAPSLMHPHSLPTFATKKYIVDLIFQDVDKVPFSVYAYSSAIYTYEYDYLFQWLGKSKYGQTPIPDSSHNYPIYLIIPQSDDAIRNDFINYKTPNREYKTMRQWQIEDGTTVLRRGRL